jgi:hypothetical protein
MQRRVKIDPIERHARLGQRRFKRSEIAYSRRAARVLENGAVKCDHFTEGEIAHGPSSQALVQFVILRENATRSLLKLGVGRREQIGKRSASKIFRRKTQALGFGA